LNRFVLIVDDEPMARTLLRLMLARAGYSVSEAQDGLDALKKIEMSQPDVVVLDVMMPGMDGFTVCKTLREKEDTSKLPVIMLSAKSDMESINKGLSVGANKYLTKPISSDELNRHVQELLDNVEPSSI